MAVILWKVLRQRSIYGSLLKNWLITEAVLMSGSMINTQPGSSDIPMPMSNCQPLAMMKNSLVETSENSDIALLWMLNRVSTCCFFDLKADKSQMELHVLKAASGIERYEVKNNTEQITDIFF